MQKMRRIVLWGLVALCLCAACKRNALQPRPTIPLVESIVADTTGTARMVALAGSLGPEGSIAIIGEPSAALALAHRFQGTDRMDNVDGRPRRDSLPDFAGEVFSVILDVYNAPYEHFFADGPDASDHVDSLREAAVRNALFAWDSTAVRPAAKILIFTSSLQAEYGLFDVDTLQQLCGGASILLSPASLLLDRAHEKGARNLAVWTTRPVRKSGAWQSLLQQKGWADMRLTVLSPTSALDSRTELRELLRQYQSEGRPLDALLIDNYEADLTALDSEISFIRQGITGEDATLGKMLSQDFFILDPSSEIIQTTYGLLRSRRLFAHRIARPRLQYYQVEESSEGEAQPVPVSATYVQNTYVQNIH